MQEEGKNENDKEGKNEMICEEEEDAEVQDILEDT